MALSYQPCHPTGSNLWTLAGSILGAITAYYAGTNLDLTFDLPASHLVSSSVFGTAFFQLGIFRILHQMNIVVTIFDPIEKINLYDLNSIHSPALFPTNIVPIFLVLL